MSSPRSPVSTEPSIYSPQPVYHPNVRSPSLHSQTLSDYEPPGKASSLAPPSLFRGSSSNTSSDGSHPPVTPTDEALPNASGLNRHNTVARYCSAESSYGRRFVPGVDKSTVSPTRTQLAAQAEPAIDLGATRTEPSQRHDVSLVQRTIDRGNGTELVLAPRMQRRPSTKELIDRCEQRDSSFRTSTPPSMARRNAQLPPVPSAATATASQTNSISSFKSYREPTSLPRAPPSHCVPEEPSYFSNFARTRGKLRNSLTNLVQLLGEKTKPKDKDGLALPLSATKRNSLSPSASRTFNALSKGVKLRLGKRMSFEGAAIRSNTPGSSDGVQVPGKADSLGTSDTTEIGSLQSGLLLYQSPARQVEPTADTLWMPYTVSVYPTSLVLQIPNPRLSYLSTSKFHISLLDMSGVRSIDSKDLPLGFVNPPPGFKFETWTGEDGELYVFEVESSAGRTERFAAGDFGTRKAWIDALIGRRDALAQKRSQKATQEVPATHPLSPLIRSRPSTPIAIEALETCEASLRETQLSAYRRKNASRLLDSTTASGNRSYLPNPWDAPRNSAGSEIGSSIEAGRRTAFSSTPTRATLSQSTRLTSPASSVWSTSAPGSVKSERAMTASPSITRLDERSLVKNRLAMLERQAGGNGTPSISRQSSRSTAVGPINWEVLAEVRGGRVGSRFSAKSDLSLGGRPDSGLSMRGTVSGIGEHRPFSVLSRKTIGSLEGSESVGDEPFYRHQWSSLASKGLVDNRVHRTSSSSLQGPPKTDGVASPGTTDTSHIQVLENVHPRSARMLATPQPDQPTSDMVSDRIASLTAALRESDVAHSTKASGLGRLVASAQDRILQAIEDHTKTSSREYALSTGHLERLQESVQLLAPKVLDVDTQLADRTEKLTMKEALERMDKGVAEQGAMIEQLHELKGALDLLSEKLSEGSVREDILAKLEVLETKPAAPLDSTIMEELAQQIKAHISSLNLPTSTSIDPQLDTPAIMTKLDLIAASVAEPVTRADLLDTQRALDEIKELVTQYGTTSLDSEALPLDLSDIEMKLDGISAMCQSFMGTKMEASDSGKEEKETLKQEANEKLMHLLAALREDADHRTTQAEQTSELVRYSNELNAWLEKFVTNASTQMDNVGAGIGALRRDLGLDPSPASEGQLEANMPPQGTIERLRTTLEEQANVTSEINATLNSLVASMGANLAQNEEARQQKVTEAVLKVIEDQRQEQERLLRKLATDLSSDIRGERLRFVEAMSHATSMNIQAHVEEFKKQLTREVLALTDEVGRLREERKTIQHQIAQLFLIKSEHEGENRNNEPPPVPAVNTRPAAR